jgi:hypothetical protein
MRQIQIRTCFLIAVILLCVVWVPGCGVEGKEALGKAPVPCGPYRVENGKTSPDGVVVYPARVRISCDIGYVLSGAGEAAVRCEQSGHFTQGKVCTPVSCGETSITGGVALPLGPTSYPNSVRITCATGFKLLQGENGNALRRCQHDGTFSPGATCKPSERWVSADPIQASAAAESELKVTGLGFVEGSFYECKFSQMCPHANCPSMTTRGQFKSDSEIICRTPFWPHASGLVELSILKAGMTVDKDDERDAAFRFTSSVTNIEVRRSSLSPQSPILRILGAGFSPSRCYRCLVTDATGQALWSDVASTVAPTHMDCTLPSKYFFSEPLNVSVWQVPGQDSEALCLDIGAFTEEISHSHNLTSAMRLGTGWYDIYPRQSAVSHPSDLHLSITCSGLERESHFTARFKGIVTGHSAESACKLNSSTLLRCAVPDWRHPAEQATVTLFQNGTEILFLSDEEITFRFVPKVESVTPSVSSVLGGASVTVAGMAFDPSKVYHCSFICNQVHRSSRAATVVDSTRIECISPQWHTEPCAATLSVLEDGIPILGEHKMGILAGWSRASPNTVPCCDSGHAVTVRGSGFISSDSYTCVFSQVDSPSVNHSFAAEIRPTQCDANTCSEIVCETPVLTSAATMELSILQKGVLLPAHGHHLIDFSAQSWTSLHPVTASACDEQRVTFVCPSCFQQSQAFECEFSREDGASARSEPCLVADGEVVCTVPTWYYAAGPTRVQLFEGDKIVTGQQQDAVFTFTPEWSGLSTTSGPAHGGTAITVFGMGFSQYLTYSCKFAASGAKMSAIRSAASVLGPSMIVCESPSWEQSDKTADFSLESGGSELTFSTTCTSGQLGVASRQFSFDSSWAAADSSLKKYDTKFELSISGRSFSASSNYVCRLTSAENPLLFIDSLLSNVINRTTILCQMPPWKLQASSDTLTVTYLDLLARNGTSVPYAKPQPWAITFSNNSTFAAWTSVTSSAPCSGGLMSTVRGYGFEAQSLFECQWQGGGQGNDFITVKTRAEYVSSIEMQCKVPSWDRVENSAKFSLLLGDKIVPQHARAVHYVSFSFFPDWHMPAGQRAIVAGGTMLTIVGAGLNPQSSYTVKVTGVDTSGQHVHAQTQAVPGISHGNVAFQVPPLNAREQRVQVQLLGMQGNQLVPVAQISGANFEFDYVAYWVAASSKHGLSGPVNGGERIIIQVKGVSLSSARDYTCRFTRGNDSVSVNATMNDDLSQMFCTTPRWAHGHGAVDVVVEDREAGQVRVVPSSSPTCNIFVFVYLANIDSVVHSAPRPSGMSVTITGSGFSSGDLYCRLSARGNHSNDMSWINSSRFMARATADHRVLCNVEWAAQTACAKGNCEVPPTPLPVPSEPLALIIEDAHGRMITNKPTEDPSLLIHGVRPAWSFLSASTGPALGGTVLTVVGWGFAAESHNIAFADHTYTLRFSDGRVQVDSQPVKAENASMIVFRAPRFSREATVTVSLVSSHADDVTWEGRGQGPAFKFTQAWSRMDVSQGFASGGSLISLSGHAFESSKAYKCMFSQLAGGARGDKLSVMSSGNIMSEGLLECRVPAWAEAAGLVRLTVHSESALVAFAGRQNANTFQYMPVWSGLSDSLAQVELPASGASTLTVAGNGFLVDDDGYACVFTHGEMSFAIAGKATSTDTIECVVPAWNVVKLENRLEVEAFNKPQFTLTVDHARRGIPLALGVELPTITFVPSVEEIFPSTFLAGHDVTVSVKTAGLDANLKYACKLEDETAGQTEEIITSEWAYLSEDGSLKCRFGQWAQAACACSLRIISDNGKHEVQVPNQQVMIQPTCNKLRQEVLFAQRQVHVAAECSGVAKLRSPSLSCVAHTNSSRHELWIGSAHVVGANSIVCRFSLLEHLSGRFNLQIIHGQKHQMHWNGEDGRDVIDLDHSWWSVDGPSEGHTTGGTRMVVHGNAFSLSRRYACKFASVSGHVAVSDFVLPTTPSLLECVTPSWSFPDVSATMSVISQDSGVEVLSHGLTKDVVFGYSAKFDAQHASRPSFELSQTTQIVEEDQFSTTQFMAKSFLSNIQAGASAEAGHSISFTVVEASAQCTRDMFVSFPSIDAEGALMFLTKMDMHGSCTLKVQAVVDHKSGDMQQRASEWLYFTVLVMAANDAPSFALGVHGSTIVVSEDSYTDTPFLGPATARDIEAGPSDENQQLVSFSLVPVHEVHESLFAEPPSMDTSGTLRFKTNHDQHGSVSYHVLLSDDSGLCSTSKMLTIVIEPVNDQPSFAISPTLRLREDQLVTSWPGFAFNILPEHDPEEWQGISFTVTVEHGTSGLFKAPGPRITTDGTLLLELEPEVSGHAHVLVYLEDDGGTSRGGVDRSHIQRFDVVVEAVNDAPIFSLDTRTVQVLEDSGHVRLSNFAANIRMGPSEARDEASQTGTFFLRAVSGEWIFDTLPAISAEGVLTMSVLPNMSGESTWEVVLSDDGGDSSSPSAGAESVAQNFTIQVIAVNDRPEFELITSVIEVLEDSSLHSIPVVKNLSPGGGGQELDQSLSFSVRIHSKESHSNLFADDAQPFLNTEDGTLEFGVAEHVFGEATLAVYLHDNGGRVHGGQDTSDAQYIRIIVTPCNDAPKFTLPSTVLSLPVHSPTSSSMLTVHAFATDIAHGPWEQQSVSFEVVQIGGSRRLLSSEPLIDDEGTLKLELGDDPVGEASFAVRAKDDGGTDFGGRDVSEMRHFHVRRLLQDTKPSFSMNATATTKEDVRTAVKVASGMDRGAGQGALSFVLAPVQHRLNGAMTFTQGAGITALFSSVPTIDPTTGMMDFSSLVSDSWGTVDFDVQLKTPDLSSTAKRLRVIVESVNDLPEFTANALTDLTGRAREEGPVYDTYKIPAYASNVVNGGIDERAQLISFSWVQTSGKAGVITSLVVECEVQLPCTNGVAVIQVKRGEFDTIKGLLTITDSLGKAPSQSWFSLEVSFKVPAIETPPSFALSLDQPCDITRTGAICRKPLQIDENCECDSSYTWGQVVFQDVNLAKTIIPVATLNPCVTCTRESAQRRLFVLEKFVLPSAGFAWENKAQTVTFTVVEQTSGSGGRSLFDNAPAINPQGTLTFKLKKDHFGVANVTVTIRDSGTGFPSFTSTIQFNVSYVNQPPTFKHHLLVVYETLTSKKDSSNYSIVNAVHTPTAGKSVNINTGVDVELPQKLTFTAAAVQRETYFLSEPSITQTGTLSFTIKDVVIGAAYIAVTLKDDGADPKQTTINVQVYIRPINGKPSYQMADVHVYEDANCRTQNGWFTSAGNEDYAFPSGCYHTIFGSLTQVRAGLGNEECANCVGPHKVPCIMPPPLCRAQNLSFLIDDVSDPAMFHIQPSLSAEDGALRFSLWPDAAGNVNIYMRVADDGPGNTGGFNNSAAKELCDNVNEMDYCGPGTREGSPEELGIDTSQPAVFVIHIHPVNDRPSLSLNRDVTCLDRRENGTCACQSQTDALQSNANCIEKIPSENNTLVKASVQILENSGLLNIDGFATDMSTSSSVPGGAALFEFGPVDGQIQYRSQRKDPILGYKGLEMAVDFAMSSEQRHVYTAEYESSTLSILERPPGGESMRFLDRRSDGEQRTRFSAKQTFATQAACSAEGFVLGSNTWVGVGQGCLELNRTKAYLPSVITGDALASQAAPYIFGYLWNHTVAMWDMSAKYASGTVSRPNGCNTQDKVDTRFAVGQVYDTFISPSSIVDRRGKFPSASMWGMDEFDTVSRTVSCRKAKTFMDAPVGEQGNVYTMLANNGKREAMQFDGKLNPFLVVTNDLDDLKDLMPTRAFSIEAWFTIDTPTDPNSGTPYRSGLFSAFNGDGESTSAFFKIRGINVGYETSLGYSTPLGVMYDVKMRVVMGIEYMAKTQLFDVVIKSFVFKAWHHAVWTYDGKSVSIFFDGAFIETKEICKPAPDLVDFPGFCPLEMPMCKWDGTKCLHVYPEGVSHLIRGSAVIGGSTNNDMETQGVKYHYGMISTVKIFDVNLSTAEVFAAYNASVSDYTTAPVSGTVYWSKALPGSNMLTSPTTYSADVQARSEVRVRGRFAKDFRYRCRWTLGNTFVESPDAQLTQARSTWGHLSTCASRTVNDPIAAKRCSSQLICCDDSFVNELVCRMPEWPFGYTAAVMTVIQSATASEWTSGTATARVLWQRTCLRDECGFMEQTYIAGSRATVNGVNGILAVPQAMWWINGNISAFVVTKDIFDFRHFFGLNRGDLTYFMARTSSYLQKPEVLGTNNVSVSPQRQLPMATGVSSFKAFMASNRDQMLAIGNFWDGLSMAAVSPLVRVTETANRVQLDIVQNIPTFGATGWSYFTMLGGQREFIAVSNFLGASAIYPFSRRKGAVHSISIVKPGTGYVSGIMRTVSAPSGSGFLARFTASPYAIRNPYVQPPKDGVVFDYFPHTYGQGRLVCDNPERCVNPIDTGGGYNSSAPTNISDMPLYGIDINCTAPCDPLFLGGNCNTSLIPLCYQRPILGAMIDFFYSTGCAINDTDCETTRMTGSITDVSVLTKATLEERFTTQSPLLEPRFSSRSSSRIGHSAGCIKTEQTITPLNMSLGSIPVLAYYNVDSQGSVTSTYFAKAADHGAGYTSDPQLILSDNECRCGTTITEVNLLSGGSGYTAGWLEMEGGGGKDSILTYSVLGNVSDILLDPAANSGGSGFSSVPRIQLTKPASKGGTGVQAFAVLQVKQIVVLQSGNYTEAPLVEIDAPSITIGGVQATGYAVMSKKDPYSGTMKVESVVLTNLGYGYVSVPRVTFIDIGPPIIEYVRVVVNIPINVSANANTNANVNANANATNGTANATSANLTSANFTGANFTGANFTQNVTYVAVVVKRPEAVAYSVLSIKYVKTNHDEVLIAPRAQQAADVQLLRKNYHWWFSASQDGNYTQDYSIETTDLVVDMKVEIEQQHASTVTGGPVPVLEMVFLCESCWLADNTEYFVARNRSFIAPVPNRTNGSSTKQSSVPGLVVVPTVNKTYTFVNGSDVVPLTEQECELACIEESKCMAMDYGTTGGGADGACWFKTVTSGFSDPTWWDRTALPKIQKARERGPYARGGCTDLAGWKDIDGRTCADYTMLRWCDGFIDNTWEGPGWRVGEPFSNRSSKGVHAGDACCMCGALRSPIYKAFLKVHTSVIIPIGAVETLLCRRAGAPGIFETVNGTNSTNGTTNATEEPSDTADCYVPFSVQNTSQGARCCIDLNAVEMPALLGTDGRSIKMKGLDFGSGSVTVDASTSPLSYFGASQQTIRMAFSSPATARPVVTGTIAKLKQLYRGTGYTSAAKVQIYPKIHPEYHDRSLWGLLTTKENLYSFAEARVGYFTGFRGQVPGAFDGTVLDNLCTKLQSSLGLCDRENPYGEGYGACIAPVRASGAQVVASTAPLEMGNVTHLPTAGASGMTTFDIGTKKFLVVSNYFDSSGLSYVPTSTSATNAFYTDKFNAPVTQVGT